MNNPMKLDGAKYNWIVEKSLLGGNSQYPDSVRQ